MMARLLKFMAAAVRMMVPRLPASEGLASTR